MALGCRHWKTVSVRTKDAGICVTSVPKEEHEITAADRAWAHQNDIDWMWWCFLVGVQIADLAKELEVEPDKVKRMIDRIIAGEKHTTIEEIDGYYHLDNKQWTPRQEKLLTRLREQSCSPTRAARLLSRLPSSVKKHLATLSPIYYGQQRLPI